MEKQVDRFVCVHIRLSFLIPAPGSGWSLKRIPHFQFRPQLFDKEDAKGTGEQTGSTEQF